MFKVIAAVGILAVLVTLYYFLSGYSKDTRKKSKLDNFIIVITTIAAGYITIFLFAVALYIKE